MALDRRRCGPAPAACPPLQRCLVMGVVNVTPDSFSDGGNWLEPDAAIAHGLELAGQGADIVDVGGESTRPGAQRVPRPRNCGRVLPVVDGAGRGGLLRQHRHHAGRGRQSGAGGGRADGQRRQRRPGRPGHGRGGRRGRRAVRRHALARAQRRHVRAGVVRRRRRRGAGRAWPAGARRSSPPGWTRAAHRGPRPRLRQAARAQLGAAGQPATASAGCPVSRSRSRCWWRRRARDSSASCWPARTVSRGPSRAATTRPSR